MRLPVILLAAALAGLAAWFLLRDGGPRRPAAPAAAPEDVRPRPAVPVDPVAPPGPEETPPPPPSALPVRPSAADERGPCVLHLDVLDAATTLPAPMRVRLWRLGLPGDGTWTAGDQVVREVDVGKEGVDLPDLPRGDYRAQCLGKRRGADDPDAFRIDGERVERALRVETPRPARVRLRVHDGEGGLLASGSLRTGGVVSTWRDPDPPRWASPRTLLRPDPDALGVGGGGGGSFGGRHAGLRPVAAAAADGLFDLGEVPGPEAAKSSSRRFTMRFEGRNEVEVRGEAGAEEESIYVAPAFTLRRLAAGVTLPSGRDALEAGATVDASCTAVRLDPRGDPSVWRRIPVKVQVRLEGHALLEYDFLPDEPDRIRRLEPAKAGGE